MYYYYYTWHNWNPHLIIATAAPPTFYHCNNCLPTPVSAYTQHQSLLAAKSNSTYYSKLWQVIIVHEYFIDSHTSVQVKKFSVRVNTIIQIIPIQIVNYNHWFLVLSLTLIDSHHLKSYWLCYWSLYPYSSGLVHCVMQSDA